MLIWLHIYCEKITIITLVNITFITCGYLFFSWFQAQTLNENGVLTLYAPLNVFVRLACFSSPSSDPCDVLWEFSREWLGMDAAREQEGKYQRRDDETIGSCKFPWWEKKAWKGEHEVNIAGKHWSEQGWTVDSSWGNLWQWKSNREEEPWNLENHNVVIKNRIQPEMKRWERCQCSAAKIHQKHIHVFE